MLEEKRMEEFDTQDHTIALCPRKYEMMHVLGSLERVAYCT